jgi:hypothetical protein
MVIESEGALPPARRKRRRPRKSNRSDSPTRVQITTVTVIRAYQPFEDEDDAKAWLQRLGEDEFTDGLLNEALFTLDRARAADAAASGRPFAAPTEFAGILTARIGYGDGDRISEGRFTEAFDVDARGGVGSRRRERLSRTAPIARIAAIIGEKGRADSCEFLVPRVRADLDTGRIMTAALGIEMACRSTVAELDQVLDEPDHVTDLDQLEAMLPDLTTLTDSVLTETEPWPGLAESLEEPLAIAERILRRRRVLDQ